MQRFTGKAILVTGAASGIGFASAEQFAREGATVIATDLRLDDLNTSFRDIEAEGFLIEKAVQDVTDRETWFRMVHDIVERHGRLDVLFKNVSCAALNEPHVSC